VNRIKANAVGKPLRPKSLRRARILLVDDDERNLLALSEVLEELAEVVCVTSGKDALRALLKGDFAVILLDVFMPGIDGYETASLIRERQQTARIPIIFLSAVNKETEHLMRGYAMGAVDYVFKPVEPLMLQSKVSVFVDLYEMHQGTPCPGDQVAADHSVRARLGANDDSAPDHRRRPCPHDWVRRAAIDRRLARSGPPRRSRSG
jgi:CheY-like chemotaxis protein